jgi:hypothetical protein
MRILRSLFMLGIFGIVAGCDSTSAAPPSTTSPSGNDASEGESVDSGGGASEASEAATVDSSNGANDATTIDAGKGGTDAPSDTGNGASDAVAATSDGGGQAGSGHSSDGGSDATSTDAGGDAGSCKLPSCLGNLDTGCVPSGTCSQTTDDTTGDVYSCYTNGITRGDLTDPNTGDQILTAKNATSTCYSIDYVGNDIGSDIATTATVTNRSDAGVATLHATVAPDGVTTSWSVTCSGGAPVALDSACKSVWPLDWMINERNGPQDCTTSTTCKF